MSEWGAWGTDEDLANEGVNGGSEDAANTGRFFGARDGLVFLIDCSSAMFERRVRPSGGDSGSEDSEETYMEHCLKCVKSVFETKIIGSNGDCLGVVLFATREMKNSCNFQNVYVMQDLGPLNIEKMKAVEVALEDQDEFKSLVGQSAEFSLADAFWVCATMFTKSSISIGSKRIMLFTNNDNPHAGSRNLQTQAKSRADDLHGNDIELQLLHMKPPVEGKKFDIDEFYTNLLYCDDEDRVADEEASDAFEDLLNRVRMKEVKKRARVRIPLTLQKGVTLHVGLYNLVRKSTLPSSVRLETKTNEPITSKTRVISAETGDALMSHELKKYITYAQRDIRVDSRELGEIKDLGIKGLQLIGFKSKDFLKPFHHVKAGSFLYPDEGTTTGSTTLFSALLNRCLERDVVPVCWFRPTTAATVDLVALVPQAEELDKSGSQIEPPGFHVTSLAFTDDVRTVEPPDEAANAPDKYVDVAKRVLKPLQFSYTPLNFDSPKLQKFYATLEAIALEKEEVEMVDRTLPDHGEMERIVGAQMTEFVETFGLAAVAPGERRPASSGEAAKKPPIGPREMMDRAQKNELGRFTVPQLKEFIRSNNITSRGTKKQELIDSIKAHYGL